MSSGGTRTWPSRVVAVAVLACASTVSADTTTEVRTTTLEFDDVILGGEVLDETIDWRPKRWLKITGDALASLGEHHVYVPTRWSASYDQAAVQPASWVTLYIGGYTDAEPSHVLQTYSAGLTLTLAVAYKTFLGWIELGWGLDFGIDFQDEGKPPMAGESSVAYDTMQTGIWIPPGPPGAIPTLAEVVVRLGSEIAEGRLEASLSVTNGTLYDCYNNPQSSIDFVWPSAAHIKCIRVQVDPTVGDGDFLSVTLANLTYVAETEVPVALQAKIVGAGAPAVPLGSIPTSGLEATTSDEVTFEIPIQGAPANLIAGHIVLSNDPRRLWPENDYRVHGYVINSSTVVDLATSSTAELAIRPIGGGDWTVLGTAELAPLDANRAVYVQADLSAPDFGPGDYEIRLAVDTGDTFAEANELDNETSIPITIVDIPPDPIPLADTVVVAPAQPRVDQAFDISVDVMNDPRATAHAVGVEVALAIYDPTEAAWSPLGSATITSLAPGATATATVSVAAPSPGAERSPGSYVVRATVDPDNAIAELREGNNHTYDGLQLSATGPDLYATISDLHFVSTPTPPLPSTNTIVWFNVRNGGGSEAQDVTVHFSRVKGTSDAPVRVDLGTETLSWVSPGASREVAIQFVPQEADSGEPAGEWMIEATIEPTAGETDTSDNVVQRPLYVGTPVGDLELRVEDETEGSFVDGAEVALSPAGLQTTSLANAIPEAFNPLVNARIPAVPQGTQTLTISKTGYLEYTAELGFYGGQPTYAKVLLEPDPAADLTGEVRTEPPEPAPGSFVEFEIRLVNIGAGEVVAFSGIVIAIYLNGDRIGQAVIDDPIPAGGSLEVTLPGGPYMLAPIGDSFVELVVDEGNAVVEVSEGNNTDFDIVTNPEAVVTIDSVAPDPADYGQPVTLAGSATDATGQVLAVQWWSSRDGLVATRAVAEVTDLSVGVHTLTLRAADEHDEWAEAELAGVTILDSTPPIPRLLYSAGDTLIAPASPLFVWVADDDSSPQEQLEYAFYLEGMDSDFGSWSGQRETLYSGIGAGSYTFWVKARDLAGNESSPGLSKRFEVVAPRPDAGPDPDGGSAQVDAGPVPDGGTGADSGDGGCCQTGEDTDASWWVFVLLVTWRIRRSRTRALP